MVAAAVILCDDFDISGLDDSKKLSVEKREAMNKRILDSASRWGIGVIGPEVVDRINILQATFLAMKEAILRIEIEPDMVMVDGRMEIPGLGYPQKAVIGGDGKIPAISAASILAKVHRDEIMEKLDREYPGYGFRRHKGYPTSEHIASLGRLGPCPVHRRSFRPVSEFYNN